MKKWIGVVGLLLASVTSLSLAAQPMANMEAQNKTTQASHQGTGKVLSVDRAKMRVRLAHEPIKSLGWPGMTMEFNVEKILLLDTLKEGDAVRFELRQSQPNEWVIVKIERR